MKYLGMGATPSWVKVQYALCSSVPCVFPHLWLSSPCLSSPHSVCVVLYHLRQADLITEGEIERLKFSLREESKRLTNFSDVIQVQSGKHLEVVAKTADVLRKHGFDHVSQYLEGR